MGSGALALERQHVERVLAWMGALVGMGGPIWTIRTHDTRDWAQRQPQCHPFLAHRHGLLKDGWWNLHCRLVLDGAGIQVHDVPIAAIPTMGESWHNNHHAFPGSARHGLYPGQVDPGYRFIQILEFFGLAWNVQLPSRLPPRPGITPVRAGAESVAAAGQVGTSRRS